MIKYCGIYSIENLVTNKKYYGQSQNIDRRIKEHINSLKNNKHYNEHLQRAFNYYTSKYGDIWWIQIEELCDVDKLDEREIYYISKDNTIDKENGYNNESGGNANKIVSEETRKKMGKLHKGINCSEETKKKIGKANLGKIISEETRKKISEAKKGIIPWNKGIARTEETKMKISRTKKGITLSAETKNKMSETRKGRTLSDETKKKLSESHKGIKHSEESKKKMSELKKLYYKNKKAENSE